MTLTLDLTQPDTRAALRPRTAEKPSLIGLTREEMAAALGEIGIPEKQRRMRVQQLWHWLYVRGVSDFAHMFNISKELRGKLAEAFAIARSGSSGTFDMAWIAAMSENRKSRMKKDLDS